MDIYMPDFKFWSAQTAMRLAKGKDYPERARESIRQMHRQVGDLHFGPGGLACRGVARAEPGHARDGRSVLLERSAGREP